MFTSKSSISILALILAAVICSPVALGHGDGTPQAVDTEGLEALGDELLEVNPYREKGGEQYALAIKIGSSGYSQNCARCHGLQVISGGMTPDLRLLEDGEYGDEWYIERVRRGYTQNGAYKMPPFENLLSQEAMWAIRSYIENEPKPE